MRRIKDLKTRGIGTHSIERDASLLEAAREFVEKRISSLVVYEDGKLAGLLTKNDLVRAVIRHPDRVGELKVGDWMKTDLYTADIDSDLEQVMEVMRERGFHHVPVLEGDRVVGMVTPIDILAFQRIDAEEERSELIRYVQGSY